MTGRTTVNLPVHVEARLRSEAELRGQPMSEISRAALEAFVGYGTSDGSADVSYADSAGGRQPARSIGEAVATYATAREGPFNAAGADRERPLGRKSEMKTTTIKLPQQLDALVRAEAGRRGFTLSEFTQMAVSQYLGIGARRRLRSAASGQSGHTDTAWRAEELLFDEGGSRFES